jgi:hypothetical protein
MAQKALIGSAQYSGDELAWHGYDVAPDFAATTAFDGDVRIIPVWENLDRIAPSRRGTKVAFPEEWGTLAGARCPGGTTQGTILLWNENHPLIRAASDAAMSWVIGIRTLSRDPLAHRAELLESPDHAAAWILHEFMYGESIVWNGVVDRDASFLTQIWKAVPGLEEMEKVLFSKDVSVRRTLEVVTPSRWSTVDLGKITNHLPQPGPDWRLAPKGET